ncbi:MAG: Holliday junction DNA helicase RuvB [Chlamydia sp. 32-24]|nr:MAG: Holliday junction DNA helicase RuvB [Chlamydia sp. 32-24]
MNKSFIESSYCQTDVQFEIPIRPQSLKDFMGQDNLKNRLDILITAAKQRKDPLGHCLFSGPPGLGKTTLANILANAMGTNLVTTSGPAIEKPGDLAGVLTNLQEGDILFIDEIHRLNRVVEEYLYTAMEDYVLDLIIDKGPSARTVQVKLNKFTLVGATTRMGLLQEAFRSRFAFTHRLEYYTHDTLQNIIQRSGLILNLPIDSQSARRIAERSRGTPRIANHLLRWVRDYVQTKAANQVNEKIILQALHLLEIDEKGLDEMDIRILEMIIDHYEGGPVGLNTIATAIGEEPHTIEEVYEPYLIMIGFLIRTPRGRKATHLAWEHLEKRKMTK